MRRPEIGEARAEHQASGCGIPPRRLALLLVVLLAAPPALSTYWINVLTAVAIYSVVALGLGLLMGRVGLVSLGQIAVLALGAWVAAKLAFATSIPFPLVLLIAGRSRWCSARSSACRRCA